MSALDRRQHATARLWRRLAIAAMVIGVAALGLALLVRARASREGLDPGGSPRTAPASEGRVI